MCVFLFGLSSVWIVADNDELIPIAVDKYVIVYTTNVEVL